MDPAAAAGFPGDAVEVGRVVGAWGVKGWVRVHPYSDDPQALLAANCWYLRPDEGIPQRPIARWPSLLHIAQVREHGDSVVAQVAGVGDRDAAEALRGARIFVSRAAFPAPAEDEFYWVDLIGLEVINRAGQTLGRVAGLLDTGAHSVLQVHDANEAAGQTVERLIPFVEAYVDRVDLAGGRILVDWGLDY